jgi:hypothetical protein
MFIPFLAASALEAGDRPRCWRRLCTVENDGCPTVYTEGGRLASDAFFSFTAVFNAEAKQLCGHLCSVSRRCTAHSMPSWGQKCYHWDATAAATGNTAAAVKLPGVGGPYTVTYDQDVDQIIAAAQDVRSVSLNRCYEACGAENCAFLAFDAKRGRCALGATVPTVRRRPGDGLFAVRTSSRGCPAPTIAAADVSEASTRGRPVEGFFDAAVLPGTNEILGRTCRNGVWCPVFHRCVGDMCNGWQLGSTYYSPRTRCRTDPSECPGVGLTNLRVAAAPPLPGPVPILAASADNSASNSTVESSTDIEMVEIVITSVVGGCGLVLIAVGFYYRRQIADRIA